MNALTNRADEIRKELNELNQSLKMSVQKAINIGRLLSEQKAEMKSENDRSFVLWINENFDMGQRNAYRYMSLFYHQNKIAKMANLQEAYLQIEHIEQEEKQTQSQKDNALISIYKRTKKKPEGWERRHDYLYEKMQKSDEEFKQRMAQMDKEREERKKLEEEKQKQRILDDAEYQRSIKENDDLIEALKISIAREDQDKEIKEKLRLANRHENLSQEIIFETIDDYLLELKDDSRRIESAQNIIKYLRDKIVNYQVIKK